MPRRASSSTTGWWTDAITSRTSSSVPAHRASSEPMPPVFGPGVALADPLVVARGRERDRALAVAQRQQRELVARRGTPRPPRAGRRSAARRACPRARRAPRASSGRDHDALARGQPVGLDHGRIAGDRRHALVDARHDAVRRGRDAGRLHDLLRERLRALQSRGGRRRPEAAHARRRRARRRARPRAAPPGRRRPGRRRRRARRAASAAGSSAGASSGRASRRIPALPGAQRTSGACGERSRARTSACSRPPDPTTRTLTAILKPRR